MALTLKAKYNENCASGVTCEIVDLAVNEVKNYDYSGTIKGAILAKSGYYKLEVWGAQGGNANSNPNIGGYGGYGTGLIKVLDNDVLYIVVGSQGTYRIGNNQSMNGGYNGGGGALTTNYSATASNASGGGATHIATHSGLLSTLSSYSSSVLIVAGGGGGGSRWQDAYWSGKGGSGGGITGVSGIKLDDHNFYGIGGSQSIGGTCYPGQFNIGSFGAGGYSDYSYLDDVCKREGCSSNNRATGGGGGGGYYGGGGGCHTGGGGGGGSGYIGSSNLISGGGVTKHMTCYSCTTSTATATYTISNTNVSGTATADYSKTGNGFARITYLGTSI